MDLEDYPLPNLESGTPGNIKVHLDRMEDDIREVNDEVCYLIQRAVYSACYVSPMYH